MPGGNNIQTFPDLNVLARHLRDQKKKVILLFAYNGTGKTRLSMAFKDLSKDGENRDTLYFNAFTEDLFTWDNDLENDAERVLRMNTDSHFFDILKGAGQDIEKQIRSFMHRYADFDFEIDYSQGTIRFSHEQRIETEPGKWETQTLEAIKISRGEENIFIWCFFLAIAQLAIEGQEAYEWVKFIYIDDPISSLDENNAIAMAVHLARMLKQQNRVRALISSHHTLFFNVLCNEMNNAQHYFLSRDKDRYHLRNTSDTPRFYHVAMLKELHKVAQSGKLYTYHFTILRSIMEKTATFHGFNSVGNIVKREPDDEDGMLHYRYVQLLSHGNYSLFEPVEMLEENKEIFRKILNTFMNDYRFNPELFPEREEQEVTG